MVKDDIKEKVDLYINLRKSRLEIESEVKKIKEEETNVQADLIKILEENGFESIKTSLGTTYISEKSYYSIDNLELLCRVMYYLMKRGMDNNTNQLSEFLLFNKTVNKSAIDDIIKLIYREQVNDNISGVEQLDIPDDIVIEIAKKIGVGVYSKKVICHRTV